MAHKRTLFSVALATFVLSCAAASQAGQFGRQLYSKWQYAPQQQYYYCTYYYEPVANSGVYRSHYCIYYPQQHPKECFYYDRYNKKYWGCYNYTANPNACFCSYGNGGCSTLKPAGGPPRPGPVPAIPEATDGVAISLPPDLPQPPGAGLGTPGGAPQPGPGAGAPGGGAPPAGGGSPVPGGSAVDRLFLVDHPFLAERLVDHPFPVECRVDRPFLADHPFLAEFPCVTPLRPPLRRRSFAWLSRSIQTKGPGNVLPGLMV